MVITYLGGECFKISQGELTIALNPPSKDSDLKSPKFGSDIVLVSYNHEDFNGVENCVYGEREPFAIQGPGEYEVKGVAVRGFASETSYDLSAGKAGGERGLNTVYSILFEGMNLVFLGALGNLALSKEALQELDDIDILFVPIGGSGMLDASEAYKLAVQLEPKAVVPMGYDLPSGRCEPGALKAFLKEAGAEEVVPIDKLTVKKKDLEGKEGEVIVLSA
ncbi:MBL fold metallo-hydrolase [Patescibacteria group bacterium]|nr:MBL fold metallo-hydrolase [Patescibacteria group bacterium]